MMKNQNPKAKNPKSKRLSSEVSDFKDILAIASGKNWEPVKRSGRFINANYPPDDVSMEKLAEFWGDPKDVVSLRERNHNAPKLK